MSHLVCAFDFDNVSDLNDLVEKSQNECFDYIIVPLVHPLFERQFKNGLPERTIPLTRSDLVLSSNSWGSFVVGKLSQWLAFDSPVEKQRLNARQAFKQELAWATHIGVSAVILPTPDWHCTNYAQTVHSTLMNLHYMKLLVHVPLLSSKQVMLESQGEANEHVPLSREDDPWARWNKFRLLCGHNKNLNVVLELSANLPEPHVFAQWCSEPVAALMINTNLFLTNNHGLPVLSKRHQAEVKKFFRHGVQIILKGHVGHAKGVTVYQQYMSWLYKNAWNMPESDLLEKPYWDYLQAPLQPLMDNLESSVYETFEKDPIKYQKYEDAIALALQTDPFLQNKPEGEDIVLMVLGAGRGPLVNAAMRASLTTGRKLKLYALEKNPNAVNTLMNLKRTHPDWKHVTVVSTDIRAWQGSVKADVIVSELLGSFGDNELSPECLYGAQDILKEGGISIPVNYTSFVAPLSSTKLYNESRTIYDGDSLKGAETGYVVKFHSVNVLTKEEPCFLFEHPQKKPLIETTMHRTITFTIPHDTLLHGFAGYFDSKLYGDVHISIAPQNATPTMFSWFPLYIPILTPTYVKSGTVVEFHIWRLANAKQVWYEWSFTCNDIQSPIHNPNGRSWYIGL